MKWLWAACLLPSLSLAQIPDVQIKLDLRATYRTLQSDQTDLRWYDTLGHLSLVSLQLQLEPGLRLFVSERIEKIPGDGDPDRIDEAYVEEPGNWRFGKQVLPFGGKLLRESAVGARSDTAIFVRSLPLRLAAFDGGPGRPRGICARLGRNLGASFMFGEHFGISGSSLALIRQPSESTQISGGYKRAFSLDATGRTGVFQVGGEALFLRAESLGGPNETVLDLNTSLIPSKYQSFTLGYTRAFVQSANFLRIQGSYYVYNGVTLEPILRFKDGEFFDFGLALRVKF